MNAEPKIMAIMNLMTDKSVAKYARDQEMTEEEAFGAMMLAGYLLREASRIANS